jgi:hypothetical protein
MIYRPALLEAHRPSHTNICAELISATQTLQYRECSTKHQYICKRIAPSFLWVYLLVATLLLILLSIVCCLFSRKKTVEPISLKEDEIEVETPEGGVDT